MTTHKPTGLLFSIFVLVLLTPFHTRRSKRVEMHTNTKIRLWPWDANHVVLQYPSQHHFSRPTSSMRGPEGGVAKETLAS